MNVPRTLRITSWLCAVLVAFGFAVVPLASAAAQQSGEPSFTTPTEGAPAVQGVPAAGVDRALDERVKAVAKQLRCPVCQGESIQDSPAELAVQMKDLVREQLATGSSEAQVMEYFVAKYGQWILLEPRAEGFNLLVYWLPVAFLVFGLGFVVFLVKRWTRPMASR